MVPPWSALHPGRLEEGSGVGPRVPGVPVPVGQPHPKDLGGGDAVRATQVKGQRGPPTHLCEAEEESDSAQEPQNLRGVSLHDAGTGGAGGRRRAVEARLQDGRRTRTGLNGSFGPRRKRGSDSRQRRSRWRRSWRSRSSSGSSPRPCEWPPTCSSPPPAGASGEADGCHGDLQEQHGIRAAVETHLLVFPQRQTSAGHRELQHEGGEQDDHVLPEVEERNGP